jgi:hypothetical protein
LLPWSGEGGKPCYLDADSADAGFLSRMADGLESIQLGMAVELMGYVDSATPTTSANELRGFAGGLRLALLDAARVAGSRGQRVHAPEAPELAEAGGLVAVADAVASSESADVLTGLVVTLRWALSRVVDLAEGYGEELPRRSMDDAALRAAEALGREIRGGLDLLLGPWSAGSDSGEAAGLTSALADHPATEGGS